ncbi:4-hydroxybenzoate octaprenyltransferase [Phenylobacterium sp.]|uniref:4-hydroxybenzoate octaprenyltransferase n=1 Tax=Phenylobacterium sp. TaxID=1871053 RepID=UPI001200A597|nr:4-hydroxybenzoate octaprenyltransferase [Phenylobacterium sp.]THD67121.1 MAG: 4-hydroxybenzoate octaprenyltransferase [Phenylobacterium sp.]
MTTSAPLPDAMPTNWVDRFAPSAIRPWLKIGRFDRPVGIWLLMLPGWQGIALADAMEHREPNLGLMGLVALGAALMRAAGCAYNDIVDRDIDAKVARTAMRPIPAGQISVKQAWIFVIACCLVSLTILLSLPPTAVVLGAASLVLVAAYPFMKRITWWPQAWLGLTFNWGALLGFAAATGAGPQFWRGMAPYVIETGNWRILNLALTDSTLKWPAVLLYASGVFWTLGYDTIYAIQDLEDDALAGVKSSARRLGTRAPLAILGFYLAASAILIGMGAAAGLGPLFYFGLMAYGVQLCSQARKVRLDDGPLALRLFKSNAWAGLILVLAIVAGTRFIIPS